MREIKFRAWINKVNKWADEVLISQVGDCWGYVGFYNGEKYFDCEFVQFTGLRDKNGKEIYEGDIVRLDTWKPSDMAIAFIEGAFCLASLETGEFVGDIHYIHHAEREQSEVIGNIHEFLAKKEE